jgi:hypothetical protein
MHLADALTHLPNYTCLETITRWQRQPLEHRLMPLDIVRLEIVYSDRQEWYGSPGERRLTIEDPIQFVGSGMIGNGAFGMLLSNLVSAATFHSHGEEAVRGRRTLRLDFRLPRLLKPLKISLSGGTGTVGEEGSVWVDPTSLDLVRMEANVVEIPDFLPLWTATSSVSYAPVQLGAVSALLPQQATLYMLESSGLEAYDRIDFTHCRAFSVQSELRFEERAEGASAANWGQPANAAFDGPRGAVPPFLPVTLRLVTQITDQDAVGTSILARVAGEVRHKGKIVIADGAVVHGRIRRLEHRGDSKDFLVGLEFTEIETSEGRMRFFADFLRMDKHPKIAETRSEHVLLPNAGGAVESRTAAIVLPELPGVASFFVLGKSFTIPGGFKMVWRTRGLIRR